MTIRQQVKKWTEENRLSDAAFRAVSQWLTDPEFADFVPEIQLLIEDIDEIEDAFRTHIEFGTGGIRGKMGPGPNRINLRTIGEAAQGLAQYILKSGIEGVRDRGVVIARDTRNNSDVFARETASILAGNGVVARLFDGPRATPHLSFAVRQTGAVAGVVISASHNPPSDNGFKAYWTDGGQVVPPHDKNIIAEVGAVARLNGVGYEEGVERGLIEVLDAEFDVQYVRSLANLSLCDARDIRIVYTSLHGVGTRSVVPALEKLGYSLRLVEAQAVPDGHFATLVGGMANPEDPGVLSLSIEDARQVQADMVLASDPDADRLGCALPDPHRGWDAAPEVLAMNGNQIGVILCYYILTSLRDQGKLPDRGVVCKTIVTTDLISLIARDFGLTPVDNLLVGFKYIGDVINNLSAGETFVFGAEESHGYLFTDFVRDKDAAVAAVLLAECAAKLKKQGRTLRDYLEDIYRSFGYFCEMQKSVYREGARGKEEIAQIMNGLRRDPPAAISGHQVVEVVDRQRNTARNIQTGTTRTIQGRTGNVLAFTLSEKGHTRVTVRPSGTEPKIKYYVSASSADYAHLAGEDLEQTRQNVDQLAQEIISGMLDSAASALKGVAS